jgi:hypothetical protein
MNDQISKIADQPASSRPACYATWIESYAKNCYSKCAEFTFAMQQEFPELIRVRGDYDCPLWGKRSHWWLKTETGEIIDPTVSQFPTKGAAADYIEWVEGDDEPTGKCLCCGDYVYRSNVFCSDNCRRDAYAALRA